MRATPSGLLALTALCALLSQAVSPALAADPIRVALVTNRTGPLAAVGVSIANGMRDYFEMLIQRDGGIGGAPLTVTECEAGSSPERGLACYEAARAAGAVVVISPDRFVTRALAEPSARDRMVVLSVADGFPIATRGDILPWMFNPSGIVLGGMTIAVQYLAGKAGGVEKLRGVSIGLVYSASGVDPSALSILRALAERHGFQTPLYALDESADGRGAAWGRIARERPDHLILLGQGASSGDAVEEALRAGFPPERLIALRWPDEDTVRRAGSAAKGFAEISRHAFGDAFPAFDEIDLQVVDRGLSQTPKDGSGETHYNRGIYNAVLVAEAIRGAQKRRQRAPIRGEDVRRALEGLTVDDIRWKELGLAGFARAVTLTCRDHGGHPAGFVQVWDGAKWLRATGPIAPALDLVEARLDAVGADFLAANPGWPARSEPCDPPA